MPLSTTGMKREAAPVNLYFFITLAAMIIATGLAYVSWLGICTEECAKSHSYRLYGFTFEFIGMVYFPALAIAHILSKRYPIFQTLASAMICAGIGAEILFIYVQKYLIGTWCPICLSIAAVLVVAGLSYFTEFIYEIVKKRKNKGFLMSCLFRGSLNTFAIAAGFFLAFAGLAHHNELKAEEDAVKMNIAFGNPNSPIDVYIFTDWLCPGCESLEPTFEKTIPVIMPKSHIVFVDDPVHEATLNYTPYNLSFMVNNKAQYFPLRRAMHALANEKKEPTDKDIAAMAAKYGVQLRELNYGTVAMATKYFNHLIKKFNIEGTPTVIVYNRDTKQSKKLEGRPQIDQEKIVEAITALSKKPTS